MSEIFHVLTLGIAYLKWRYLLFIPYLTWLRALEYFWEINGKFLSVAGSEMPVQDSCIFCQDEPKAVVYLNRSGSVAEDRPL